MNLLTISEVAERLNCSVANVYALIQQGKLRRVPVGAGGKGYRISESALSLFLSQSELEQPIEQTRPIRSQRKLKYLNL